MQSDDWDDEPSYKEELVGDIMAALILAAIYTIIVRLFVMAFGWFAGY